MKKHTFSLDGLMLFEPKVFGDDRGHFFEFFTPEMKKELGEGFTVIQENQSLSAKGVLRGLHFQKPPYAQGKLVRVVRGSVYDVAVDIRKESPTYGQHIGVELSDRNHHIFYVPPGFAHGFLTLEDNTIFHYKCTGLYNVESEGSIHYADPDLAISWPNMENTPLVSDKDLNAPSFQDLESPF